MPTEEKHSQVVETLRYVTDPTQLTTEQLLRELKHVREEFTIRLDGMDKAIKLVASDVSESILHSKELVTAQFKLQDERFKSVELQFKERDVRTEATQTQNGTAISAAFMAAKEAGEKQNQASSMAISKSEAATTKQMDQTVDLIRSESKAVATQISDLKERLTMLEGQKKGVVDGWGYLVGAIGFLVSIGVLITMFVSKS